MGDLRNKFRKLEETERIREMQRRLKPRTPRPSVKLVSISTPSPSLANFSCRR